MTCSNIGCERPAKSRGLCQKHYSYLMRTGRPRRTAEMPRLTDLADLAGVTYRQADHWVSRGYVDAPQYAGRRRIRVSEAHGTGRLRRLDESEAAVFLLMSRLVKSGLFAPSVAAAVARRSVYESEDSIPIGDGLVLHIGTPTADESSLETTTV